MPEYRADRSQPFLLPPSLDDWVPANHLVRFVDLFVDQLSDDAGPPWSGASAPSERGAWRYPPEVLGKLWLYGFMIGVRSTRGLERLARESIPARWLAANLTPDHNTLWRFYDRHRRLFSQLFHATVRVAYDAELIDLRLMAVDGTRIRANAAGDRMRSAEQLEQLALAVEARIAEVEAQGEADDAPPDELPPDWRQLIAKQKRIAAAQEQIATGRTKVNLTDPDAHQMTAKGINTPAYNAQAAVTGVVVEPGDDARPGGRVIVGAAIRTRADDHGCLAEMIEQVTGAVGTQPAVTLADVGYSSGAELAACAALGATVVLPEKFEARYDHPYGPRHFPYDPATDTMRCPEGTILKRWGRPGADVRYAAPMAACQACPAKAACCPVTKRGRVIARSPDAVLVEQHRAWMEQPRAQALARRRSGLVEGVFGTIRMRHHANQWLHRGRAAIADEWHLLTAAYNLRTLWRAWIGDFGPGVQQRLGIAGLAPLASQIART